MKTTLFFAMFFLAVYAPRHARAHGDPIVLGVTGNRLDVSQPAGVFPQLVFGQGGSAGLPNDDVSFLPGPGEIVYWDLPGMEISGLSDTSSLSIESLARPVVGSTSNEERLVWFWNPATEVVDASLVDMFLLGVAPRYATLTAASATSPAPFLLADSLAGQQNFHNHGLMNYAIDNSSGAPAGVYGVFARFNSNVHEPSDTFLLVLNNDVAPTDIVPAAMAIWDAANSLPGDFNFDGVVDAADYTVWRDGLGNGYTEEQYGIWKANFGQTTGQGGSASGGSVPVPEPAGIMLAGGFVVGLLTCNRRRARYYCIS